MNSAVLRYPILIPIAAGIICLVLPKKLSLLTKLIAFTATGLAFGYSVFIFTAAKMTGTRSIQIRHRDEKALPARQVR